VCVADHDEPHAIDANCPLSVRLRVLAGGAGTGSGERVINPGKYCHRAERSIP
jgi:hypothetical protein